MSFLYQCQFGLCIVLLGSSTGLAASYNLYSVPGVPLDTTSSQILYYHDRSNGTSDITARNISTSLDSVLYNFPNQAIANGYFTSHGAIFLGSTHAPNPNPTYHVYELRDGSLLDLGPSNPQSADQSLVAQGDFAAWGTFLASTPASSNHPLTLRDLSAGTNTTVAVPTGGNDFDVTSTGDVVFWGNGVGDYNIWKYHAGALTDLSVGAPNPINIYPITDGSNVVFVSKASTGSANGSIVLRTPDGLYTTLVASTPYPLDNVSYAINNGWVAFQVQTPSDGYQIWERSPDGTTTFLANRSLLSTYLKVGSDGSVAWNDIAFDGSTSIVLDAPSDTGPTVVASGLKSDTLVDWDGSSWNVVVDLPEPSIALLVAPMLLAIRKRRNHS